MVWTYLQNEQREVAIHSSYYWKPTGKRPVGRPKQRWMDNIEKDLKRASLSLYGITTGRNRVRLEELVGDREVEGHHCSIHGRTGL